MPEPHTPVDIKRYGQSRNTLAGSGELKEDDITFSTLEEDRLTECAALIRESFTSLAKQFGITPKNAPEHAAYITSQTLCSRLLRPGYHPICAFLDTRMVGFISLTHIPQREDAIVYEAKNFCVHPIYRGRGIAKELMRECIKRARKIGADKVYLTMIYDNKPMKDWYDNFGFTFIGTFRPNGMSFTRGIYEIDTKKL